MCTSARFQHWIRLVVELFQILHTLPSTAPIANSLLECKINNSRIVLIKYKRPPQKPFPHFGWNQLLGVPKVQTRLTKCLRCLQHFQHSISFYVFFFFFLQASCWNCKKNPSFHRKKRSLVLLFYFKIFLVTRNIGLLFHPLFFYFIVGIRLYASSFSPSDKKKKEARFCYSNFKPTWKLIRSVRGLSSSKK